MASYLFLIGGLFLGWVFGRNNISNLFGAAVFTRMVTIKTAAIIAVIFVTLGAFISGGGTSESMLQLGQSQTMADAFVICGAAGLVMWMMTVRGIPVSIAQAMVGSVVGYSLFQGGVPQPVVLLKTVSAWGYSPFLAVAVSFLVFKCMRAFLKVAPMSLLYRDVFTRCGLIVVGAFSGYALGANNIATISMPYFIASGMAGIGITALICIAVGIGFLTADKKVIKTMGSGLFPLTPLEALIVVFSGALTLFLFSWGGLKALLTYYGLPSFPLVPVPMTSAVIGSIIGVSFAKGGYGLKYSMLGHVILSWILTPFLGGLICWALMLILSYGVIK